MLEPEELHAVIKRGFRVYEHRQDYLPGIGAAHLYFVMFPKEEFDSRFEAVRSELLARDDGLLVFTRREGGEDILVVTNRPVLRPGRNRISIALFVLTLITTILAGAMTWRFYQNAGEPWSWAAVVAPTNVAWGFLAFAAPLLLILGVHEAAHVVAARRHGLRASLPYFLPFPPFAFPIGTLGAFISLRDPLPDRKALFDVGASGPLAGLLVAVPVLLVGAHLTAAGAIEVPDLDRPEIFVDGAVLDEGRRGATTVAFEEATTRTAVLEVRAPDTHRDWSFSMTATMELENGTRTTTFDDALAPGEARLYWVEIPDGAQEALVSLEWDRGFVGLGDSLLLVGLRAAGWGTDDFISHPVYFAGWVGILVTGINLLPAGHLDGGHVARAVLGDRMRFAGYASLGLLVYLGLSHPPAPGMLWSPWILLALFIAFMGVHHPAALNERTRLDTKRKVLAAAVLLVFVLTFVARPIAL